MGQLDNDTMCDIFYSLVLKPIRVIVKELCHYGYPEDTIQQFIAQAVSRGLKDYKDEVTKSNAGH